MFYSENMHFAIILEIFIDLIYHRCYFIRLKKEDEEI
jgi:hypothetical protein